MNPEVRRNAMRAERRACDRLGFQLHKQSGAWVGKKGDGTRGEMLFEFKSTLGESFSLKLATLRKIALEARHAIKRPMLAFSFIDKQAKAKKDGAWVLLKESDFLDLLEAYERSSK